jgi:hypothetical protein
VRFWRDPDGPEVDWVLGVEDRLLPIETKWKEAPTEADARHLFTFLYEYKNAVQGLVVCRTPRRFMLGKSVIALPWEELLEIAEEFLT